MELEDIYKATKLNTLLCMGAYTMASIAAVNSLLNNTIYKYLVFLVIGIISLIIYEKAVK